MKHPNVNDFPQGTEIEWSEGYPEQIEIITWTGYSAGDGEYNATSARFSIDEEHKTLHLERVSIKRKYSPWDDFLTNPGRHVSDHMKRVLRDFISKEKESRYWRVNLI